MKAHFQVHSLLQVLAPATLPVQCPWQAPAASSVGLLHQRQALEQYPVASVLDRMRSASLKQPAMHMPRPTVHHGGCCTQL